MVYPAETLSARPRPASPPFIGVIGSKANVHLTKESFGSGEMGKVIVGGFVDVFVFAIRLSVLLCGLVKAFERWTCRVKSCAILGLIAAAFYDRVLSTIVGVILAKFVTPQSRTHRCLSNPHNSARSSFRPKNPRIARNSLALHVSTPSCATSFAPP